MTYEAENTDIYKKEVPLSYFLLSRKQQIFMSLNSVFLLYVWRYECWWWEGLHRQLGYANAPPPKYSQTNNNLPKKASSTNKKASLERIILNIE